MAQLGAWQPDIATFGVSRRLLHGELVWQLALKQSARYRYGYQNVDFRESYCLHLDGPSPWSPVFSSVSSIFHDEPFLAARLIWELNVAMVISINAR